MPSWLESGWFQHSITRPITLRYFNVVFLVVGVVFSTLVSVIGSGYESVSTTSIGNSFNVSNPLWYERFLPAAAGIPKASVRSASTIPITEGYNPPD